MTSQFPGTQFSGTKSPGTKSPGTRSPGTKSPGTQSPGRISRRKQSGFSTLELMMAIVVLAIAVIGASLIPALSLGRSTDSKTYAANVAREVLDTYRGVWLNRLAFKSATPPSTLPSGLRFGCVLASPLVEKLALNSSYDVVPAVGDPAIIRVKVTVTCNQNKVELSTMIGDPKPGGT